MYKFVFQNFLVHLDAELVHHVAIESLKYASRFPFLHHLTRFLVRRPDNLFKWQLGSNEKLVCGPLGLAAGMDKDALAIPMWDALGFGFVEIGTITPLAQPGNERPRLWRIPEKLALRNAMGFNNSGARSAAKQLRKLRQNYGNDFVIGANIGKNKTTTAQKAPLDYRKVTRCLAHLVDFLVINVSSPNTPGLRDLQAVSSLIPIVRAVRQELSQRGIPNLPVFVKIAPDLSNKEIEAIAQMIVDEKLHGVVATNTTIEHEFGSGGLSGKPLNTRSLEVVRLLRNNLPDDKIIIGVGGITTVQDARLMMSAGANLIEGLSAFIYEGPAWPARLNAKLSACK